MSKKKADEHFVQYVSFIHSMQFVIVILQKTQVLLFVIALNFDHTAGA